jgi:hypothetical protein
MSRPKRSTFTAVQEWERSQINGHDVKAEIT